MDTVSFWQDLRSNSMSVFFAGDLESLGTFAHRPDQLAIFKREKPVDAGAFFSKFRSFSFAVAGEVGRTDAIEDIRFILQEDLPAEIRTDPFYEVWLEDMARVCSLFCEVEQSTEIRMWVGSRRGCRRYHVDNVPRRLLVTYDGRGTEWLPDDAADRDAFFNGEPNEKIVRDCSARQFMTEWDISIFRGGAAGLLHKTPGDALNGHSVLMRLDTAAFGESVDSSRTDDLHPAEGSA